MGEMADLIIENGLDNFYQDMEEWEYHETQFESRKNKVKTNINLIGKKMKSKVEKIVEVKPWNGGNNGTVYYHNLVMENGEKINIGKKKELAIGDVLNYEIVDSGQEYNKAKTVTENDFNGGAKGGFDVKGVEVGHAINNAVNLICAGAELDIKECKSTEEKIYESAKVIMAIAHRLKNEN